jgi:hypothetical protein
MPPESVLDAANVGLIAINPGFPALIAEARGRGHSLVYEDGLALVFRRPTEPHCYFTSDYQLAGPDRTLEAIGQPRRPRQVVLGAGIRGLPNPVPNAPNDPSVSYQSLRHGSVAVRVRAPRDGLLYCADSFFSGWSVRVEGQRARIEPANHAFRAVPVPAGDSLVRFSYWPPGLTLGLVVSGIGWLAVASVLGRGLWRRTRARSGPPQ